MINGKCLIILTFMLGMATAQVVGNISVECKTLKSEKGVCIKILDCTILLTLLKHTTNSSNIDFVKKSFCGFDGKYPKVCCPLVPSKNKPVPVTQNTTRYVSELPLQITNRTSNTIRMNTGNPYELTKCTTPKSEKGVCIRILDCPVLLNLVNQTGDLSNVDYLRKSLCGYNDKIADVCCPLSQPENTCGMRHTSVIDKIVTDEDPFRIFGGRKAKLGYWPWMAALGYQYTGSVYRNRSLIWNCAGTLISNKHVLTAAHCVDDTKIFLRLTTVRLGDLDLNDTVDDMANPVDILIQNVTLHPKFSRELRINDIALITLQDRVSFTEFIQPICLPIEPNIRNTNLSGKLLTIAGWGYTETTPRVKPPNTALMEVEVPVWDTEKCKQLLSKAGIKIDEKLLCAGFEQGGKDSCDGDSGGPLMLENGNQYFLMGIISFGPRVCGSPGSPSVYTNVPFFLDWVLETQKII